MQHELSLALDAWRKILGEEYVITQAAALHAVATTTFHTTQKVLAILQPASRQEVQDCVRIANIHKIPLYPVSRGKNYGYGSRVPTSTNTVVMDLSRMNRIVDFDEQLAYITIEPGVTQQQVYEFLVQQNSNLICNVTGSASDSSFIGNTAERGVGQGPGSDRLEHVCGLEVVLPTGEYFTTGFGRFAGAKSTPVHRWGLGPVFDGLFTQSNLGIITQMSMQLQARPKHFQTYLFTINDESRLPAVIDAVLQLRLEGLIVGGYTILNGTRVLSALQQYPWQATGGKTPLPPEYLQQMHIPAWNGMGSIHGASEEHGLVIRKLLRQALEGLVDTLFFMDQQKAKFYYLLHRLNGNPLYGQLAAQYTDSHFLGKPLRGSLNQLYWRKKSPPDQADLDPDRDRCGALWCAPAVPATGKDIQTALQIASRITYAHRFEPNFGLNWAQDRCIDITAVIHYDREVEGEDARAMACYQEMLEQLMAAGYYPYRAGIQGQASIPAPQDDYGTLISAVKQALDPNDILAPGRYDFRSSWPNTKGK